jgi:branched-chain amino acid transport system permease protein
MLYVDLIVQGLINGCMYAMMAVGLTLVYGLLRILHIAHATVFALGAFIGVVVANQTGSLTLAFVAAIVLSCLVGVAIYRLVYEPLLDHPPYVPMIASMGILVMMEDGFRILFGEHGLTFQHNPWFIQTFSLGGVTMNTVQAAIVISAVVLLTGFAMFTSMTRVGVGWRATVTNPRIATSYGVDAVKVRYLNFLIGSALAAVAGVLVALLNNFVEPTMGFVISYKGLAIIVLGGLGSVRGTLIASLILGIIESFGTIYIGDYLDRDAIAFLFLIAMLMVRPQGFTGGKA